MKLSKLRFLIVPVLVWAGFFSLPVMQTGCSTPADARHAQYATLKAVGDTADAVVALCAHLYASGTITAAQANQIRSIYDGQFQPAYRLAVLTARSDLSTVASPDLLAIAAQLSSLIVQFQNHRP